MKFHLIMETRLVFGDCALEHRKKLLGSLSRPLRKYLGVRMLSRRGLTKLGSLSKPLCKYFGVRSHSRRGLVGLDCVCVRGK